jgi:hypothetical protein
VRREVGSYFGWFAVWVGEWARVGGRRAGWCWCVCSLLGCSAGGWLTRLWLTSVGLCDSLWSEGSSVVWVFWGELHQPVVGATRQVLAATIVQSTTRHSAHWRIRASYSIDVNHKRVGVYFARSLVQSTLARTKQSGTLAQARKPNKWDLSQKNSAYHRHPPSSLSRSPEVIFDHPQKLPQTSLTNQPVHRHQPTRENTMAANQSTPPPPHPTPPMHTHKCACALSARPAPCIHHSVISHHTTPPASHQSVCSETINPAVTPRVVK